jgi:PAS domain S-box-containing protein
MWYSDPMIMDTQFNPSLVTLSILVAIFASYVALNLAYAVSHSKGRAQALWLGCGAGAMGVGIWSMHFVGMLAFEMPGMTMGYDIPLMLLSVAVAIGSSGIALFIASQPVLPFGSILSGGVAMAAAISGMHYIGMFSMRMAATIKWNPFLVVLSVLIALIASFGALAIFIRLRTKSDHIGELVGASVIMGFAISGMHYTGMYAATFVHADPASFNANHILVSSGLTTAVIATTLSILVLALGVAVTQRLWTKKNKRTDEILGKSEEKFRILVDAVKEYAIFMLDPEGNISTWNRGAERIFGYKDSEIMGKHVSRLYPSDKGQLNSDLETALQKGNFEFETQCLKKDGTLYWANVVLTSLRDDDGDLSGFSQVTRDITTVKDAAHKLKKLNEELEERVAARTRDLQERQAELERAKETAEGANAIKSAFLANVSHEIRTPLGAVLGFSELLLEESLTAEERQNTIEVIIRNGRLLSNIINDILDLSKVEAGKLEIEKISVDLREVLQEIGDAFYLQATGRNIEFRISSDNTLPFHITTDPLRLRQILFNIVGNAIKFTEYGKVEVTAQLLITPSGSRVIAFTVTDTGVGIRPEKVETLFSPFTQADASSTRKFGGTGLGLVLSRKLAQSLGGDVVLAETEPGAGSRFIVTIDAGLTHQTLLFDNSNVVPQLAPARLWQKPDLSSLNILVVEDSIDNRVLIRKILEGAGAVVDCANNGKEGVDKALAYQYSLVLMDLQMPEMDGYEAIKALREGGYGQPVIAVTAHAMNEERQRTRMSGFADHISKPIDQRGLLSTLSQYTPTSTTELH